LKLVPASLLALGALLALAGCGLGAGQAPTAVSVLVTREFGAGVVRALPHPKLSGAETAMSLLLRNLPVTTRFGGGFVQSIAGLGGGHEGGQPVDWFYYVNGVQAEKGAADTDVHPGDHIWWDRHDWSQAESVPAVVGSYPEPFLNGIEGKRLPVRVECSSEAGAACGVVTRRLQADGVPAAVSALGSGGGSAILRVLVGPWRQLRADSGAEPIERGPRESGVYAKLEGAGTQLTVIDTHGGETPLAGVTAGLIAATRAPEQAPTWVVTGTDRAAVQLAAADFDRESLADHFAVAVLQTASGLLPLPSPPAAERELPYITSTR
jgi:hypothetical protein